MANTQRKVENNEFNNGQNRSISNRNNRSRHNDHINVQEDNSFDLDTRDFYTKNHVEDKSKGINKNMLPSLAAAVISLKRLDIRTLSLIAGCPETNLVEYLSGSVRALNKFSKRLVFEAAGIDVNLGVLRPDLVHVFRIDGSLSGKEKSTKEKINIISDFVEGSLVAKITHKEMRLKERVIGLNRAIIALQNENVRSLLVTDDLWGSGFKIESLNACKWVRGDKKKSTVSASISMSQMIAGDITVTEFDEMFSDESNVGWKDIALAARIAGLTKIEVINLIENNTGRNDSSYFTRPQLFSVTKSSKTSYY